jgi:ABC-type branched-subunit amino acid transport system ATPase component/MFS family permease
MSAIADRWRQVPVNLGRFVLGEAGMSSFPVVALFLVTLLAFADLSAAIVMAPNIRATFGFSETALVTVAGLTGFLSTCLALPVGFISDRISRVDVVVVLALLLGLATVGSALAPAAGVYVLARLLTSVGEVSNLPVQQSLIADAYPQKVRPRAFGMHRAGQPAGMIIGALLAGAVAQVANWRVAFAVIGMLSFAVAYVAGLLRDPARGAHEGLSEIVPDRVRFGLTVRRLWRIPTLRRVWIASFALGASYLPLLILLSFFFANVYSLGTVGRGVTAAAAGVLQLGGFVAGGMAAERLNNRTVAGQMFYAGASIVAASVAVVAAAVGHTLGVSLTAALVASFLGGIYYAPFTQVLALVCPPQLRSTGLGGAFFTLGLGAAVGSPVLGHLADVRGDRVAVGVAGVILAAGGMLVASAMTSAYGDAVAAAREATASRRRSAAGLAAMAAPALEVIGVEFAYEGTKVLFGASLEVQRGETLGLLGTNGAGKSTLLRVAAGLLTPSRGAVVMDGEDITELPPEARTKRGLVLVPGGRSVFSNLSVRENLRLGTWLYRREREASSAAVDEVLDLFPLLRSRYRATAAVLSGGERQMLGLAQGLVCRPRILMVDELTLGLAPRVVEELVKVIPELRRRGLTLVLVEQSVNMAALLCERAYFMEKGAVRFCGSPQVLMQRPDLVRSVFLGAVAQV